MSTPPPASHPRTDGAEEQGSSLPVANCARIMKRVLPGNAKIAKDAKETVQSCVSEFISFITSEYVAGPKREREQVHAWNSKPACLLPACLCKRDFSCCVCVCVCAEPVTNACVRSARPSAGTTCFQPCTPVASATTWNHSVNTWPSSDKQRSVPWWLQQHEYDDFVSTWTHALAFCIPAGRGEDTRMRSSFSKATLGCRGGRTP